MVEGMRDGARSGGAVPEVVWCTSAEDLEAIYRLRYKVYVEEMARNQPHADHAGRRITDELDATGIVFGLASEGAWVGTMRLNRVSDGIGKYAEMYGLDGLSPEEARRHVIGTVLMVLPGGRRQHGTMMLFLSSLAYALQNGVDRCWIDCNPHLVSMFEGVGYRKHHVVDHALYGRVQVMSVDLRDVDHLRAIRSPLLKVYEDPKRFAPTQGSPMSQPSYLDRLRQDFERVANRFHQNPANRRFLAGELTRDEYASLMASVSLQARENPQIQAYATAFFRGAQRDMVRTFFKHAVSEIGHDQLAANDVAALGFPVDDLFTSRPRPGTVALTAFAYYTIDHNDPVSYLGYLFFLEYLPTSYGALYVAALDKAGIPKDARTFLHDHATVDVGHNKLMERYVEQLIVDEDTYQAVVYAMEVTGRLYAHMVEEAFELAPTMRAPRTRSRRELRGAEAPAQLG